MAQAPGTPAAGGMSTTGRVVDCEGRTAREINTEIRAALEAGVPALVRNPGARHNIGVALLQPGEVIVEGSAGYYCGGMNDGASVRIAGSAGWGLAEGMLSGAVTVAGNAGNSAAASIRGGTVVVHGDCAARAGVAMKGGLLLIAGDAGYMTGFMMQKGVVVIAGNAGEALADSMYEGVVFVGGEIASLGNDAVIEEPDADDDRMLEEVFAVHGLSQPGRFRKIVSGRKLWNFGTHDLETWRAAL
ncbi:MAG TPA: GXGXG motif-containing protein [Vitreimonas sp.]|nr:GXGXG motif-containing protein [Vitreimonas sp.]